MNLLKEEMLVMIEDHRKKYGCKPAFMVVSDEMIKTAAGWMDDKISFGIPDKAYQESTRKEQLYHQQEHARLNKTAEDTIIPDGYKGKWLIIAGVFMIPASECVVHLEDS